MGATSDLMMRLLFQDKATPGLKQAQRNANDFGKAIGGVNKVLGVFGVTLGGAAIVNGIANLAKLGAQADTVSASFDNLERSTGLADMLGSLRQASRGAISDLELMQAANKAMIMGGREMGQALPQLLELARGAALATGEDMQFMFNSIVTGIARQSPLILDNLGLIVDMPTAYKAYADSIGVSVSSLTEQQKMTALLNDVLRITPDYLKKVGAEGVTSAEKLAGITTAVQNIREATGEAIVLEFITTLNGAPGDPATLLNDIASRIKAQTSLKSDTQRLIDQLPLAQRETEQKRYDRIVKGLEGGASQVTPLLQEMNNRLREQVGLLPYASMLLDAYVLSTGNLAKLLRETTAVAGASYANGITNPQRLASKDYRPGYVYASDYLGGLGYQRGEAKRAGQKAGTDYATGFNDALSSAQSKAQSALTSRMSPTGLDFLLTGMGQYQNAPLENVRRLDAIIARGFSEIKAHADWASVLKIPPEVLTGSETALKAWAMQTRDAAANLARPDLVDWDAFLKEFDRLTAEEMGRQMTLDLAMGKLASSGRLGQNQDQAKRILQSMLGLDTPETQALALGEALNKAFTASDPAGIYLNAFKAGTDQNQSKIDEISKRLGSITPDGKKAAEKYLADFNATLAALSVGTTGGGYVLP